MRLTKNTPRILMFVPQYPYPVVGGLERQAHELSKALLGLGVEVRVLSGKITREQPDFETVEGIPVTRMHWSCWKPMRFLRAPLAVLRYMWGQRGDYDTIHLHQHSWVGLYVILIAKLLGKPILTKLPNVGERGIPGLRKQAFGALRMAILLRSDAIVAMSKVSVEELLVVGYSRERILTVPNGIALLPRPASRHSGEIVRNDNCRVVFVGRLSSEKRLKVLLTAWVQVQSRMEGDAILELWGEGPQENELKAQCQYLRLTGSVLFAGQVPNVRERLRAMDIFVLPSAVEGNSNAVLEAMEAGLPIVATPVGGTPMQVGLEGAPLLFPVGDAEQLAERLFTLIQDATLRRAYGEAMAQRVESYFDIQEVAVSYLSAYRVLDSGPRVDLTSCGQLPDGISPRVA